jgi:hypothetical protein
VALKVKGSDATAHQLGNGKLIVEMTRARDNNTESVAGAVATAIQESVLNNMRGGDRDSAGLYQQRPSMGWGSFAQVTTPSYAIGKFLDKYIPLRKRGVGWMTASHQTQKSAHPSAPAAWYGEGVAFANAFGGSGGGISAGSLGVTDTDQPTGSNASEFSRGSADAKEDTWVAAKRLADEVNFRFFARGGELWYVSDDWLSKQPVQYRINEFTPGVVSLAFDYETRATAAEATLRVVARRYGILPGDVVDLQQEGPGSGKWLVKEVRRSLYSRFADVALTRKRPKLPEPAAPKSGAMGANVGGGVNLGGVGAMGSAVGGSDLPSKVYQAAVEATNLRWSYSQPRRNSNGQNQYADCSSGVTWVLRRAGVSTPPSYSGNAPVSGSYVGWGQSGPGNRVTVWCNSGHIWIQFKGFPNWRFDTGGGSGGKLWPTPRSTGGFVARHASGT